MIVQLSLNYHPFKCKCFWKNDREIARQTERIGTIDLDPKLYRCGHMAICPKYTVVYGKERV